MSAFRFAFLFVALLAVSESSAFEVGRASVNFVDPERGDRVVNTRIRYPADLAGADVPVASGAFPVVAFAHGLAVPVSAYAPTWESLVPHGYIVALPSTEANGQNPDELGRDLAFVIRALQAASDSLASPFFGHVDDSGSAIAGHSMGGGASVLGAAENPWIDTLVNLAAFETNPSAIAAAANVSMPTLAIAGTSDCVTPTVTNQLPIYQNLAADCRFLVELQGGTHCGFILAGSACDGFEGAACPTDSLQRVQQLAQTEALLVPWLNAHVKKLAGAWQEFESALAADPNLTHQGDCAAVGVSVANETIARLAVWPNPSTGAVRIAFARRTGLVRLDIHDAAGRLVRRLGGVSDEMEWDGRNDEGAVVPSGTYWIRGVTGQGEVSTSKIVRVR